MNFIGDKRYLSNKISVDIYTFLSCNLFQQFLLKEDADNEFFRHASIHLHVPEVGCCVLDFSQPLHGGGGGRKGGGGEYANYFVLLLLFYFFAEKLLRNS